MLVYGQNEAYDRLKKEVSETNARGTQYPQATNNRGYEGGSVDHTDASGLAALKATGSSHHTKREYHAGGDMVGNRSQPGEQMEKPMRKGGPRMRHASGDELKVSMKEEQPGGFIKHKKGGRHFKDGDEMKRGGCRK